MKTPDIIVVPNISAETSARRSTSTLTAQEKTLYIAEISCCTDQFIKERLEDKVNEHQELLQSLQGWTVKFYPIIIGHSGPITDTLITFLRECQVEEKSVQRTATQIADFVCEYNDKILRSYNKQLRQATTPVVTQGANTNGD